MISRQLEVIDLDPEGYYNFSRILQSLYGNQGLLVVWHEEGYPRRMVRDGQPEPVQLFRVDDARQVARLLHQGAEGKLNRVIVTDLDGNDRLYAAQNLAPEPGEDKFQYLQRMYRAVTDQFDERLAVFPEPSLDRGPVPFDEMRSFITEILPDQAVVFLAVYDSINLYLSFVARIRQGQVNLVTSFDHWAGALDGVGFSADGLIRAMDLISAEFGTVACALMLERRDFERLYDGKIHQDLPFSLILQSRAFGFSVLPGGLERALLAAAGLFAYVPVYIT